MEPRIRIRAALALASSLVLATALATGAPLSGPGPRVSLALAPGSTYKTTTKWWWFDIPIYPQVAAWVETPDGRFVTTLLVTDKAAKEGWISAPAGGRPEALPVWTHRHQGPVDAVAAPTSAGETKASPGPNPGLVPGRYVVYLETNRSYDYNQRYTRENAGVGGQPSVVWKTEITVGTGGGRQTYGFEAVGTGSLDGSDGDLRPGLDGIDTALDLFSTRTVTVED